MMRHFTWLMLLLACSSDHFLADKEIDRFDVTLVYQASADRLWMMEELCRRWQGPVSLAVFMPFELTGNITAIDKVMKPLKMCGVRLRSQLYWATSESELKNYPVNRLRNMALDLVETSHLITADIDFCPSAKLYLEILSHAELHLSSPKLAVVVPAFQRRGSSCSSIEKCKELASHPGFLPGDIASLSHCLTTKDCIVFQADNNIEGHATTQSAEWIRLSPMWPAPRPLSCIASNRYEPYLVLAKDQAPRYDERFFGYGKNKIQYIHHLRFADFQFAVLPREFLIHTPHPKSTAKVLWLRDRATHSKVDAQFLHFMNDLAMLYKRKPPPLCRSSASRFLRRTQTS